MRRVPPTSVATFIQIPRAGVPFAWACRMSAVAVSHGWPGSSDEIDAAAARLAVGSYRICEVCHQPIGADRFDGRPTARTCVEHAAARL